MERYLIFILVGGDNQYLAEVAGTQPGVTSPHSSLPHMLNSLLPYRGRYLSLADRLDLADKFSVH